MSIAIKDAKSQLRKSIKTKLKTVSQESIRFQSQDIIEALRKHKPFLDARRIALYMNMPDSEVQTKKLIKTCFDSGKVVYLPRCNTIKKQGRKSNFLSMLNVPTYEDVMNLQPQGRYQLLEPTEGTDILEEGKELDVIIVPGVGFTTTKQRIGHGAGFYDEFLNVYFSKFKRTPHLIGIGLEEQLVGYIPKENHDWDLDSLVIGKNIY